MRIFLVRHAKAQKRSTWTGVDELRPLDARGERQAAGLQARLRNVPLRRICTSPALRCRQTIEALAHDHALEIEVEPRLGEDAVGRIDSEAALALLREKVGEPIVLCAGRTLISELLLALGVGRDEPRSLRCQKGSIWILDLKAGAVVRAEYVSPREASSGVC